MNAGRLHPHEIWLKERLRNGEPLGVDCHTSMRRSPLAAALHRLFEVIRDIP